MLITRGQTLFGADAILIYQAARWIKLERNGFTLSGNEKIDVPLFARAIGMPPSECVPVLNAMAKAKWLTKKRNGQYLLNPPFQQLAAARIGKPLKRTKADLLLARVIAQAKEINRMPECEYDFVLEITVFGSYLDEAKVEIGDIDIGIKTQRRLCSQELPLKRFDWRKKSGQGLVKSLLKGKSPYISIHDMSEIIDAKFTHRIVYSLMGDIPVLAVKLASA